MEYAKPQENPQEQSRKYWFFGSKLNTVLLLVLIVLVILALRVMMQDKEKYFPVLQPDKQLPVFIQEQIKNGANKIVKYNYEGKSYFFIENMSRLAVDIEPGAYVYNENGEYVECNFPTRLSRDKPINPICAKSSTTNGVTLYSKNN